MRMWTLAAALLWAAPALAQEGTDEAPKSANGDTTELPAEASPETTPPSTTTAPPSWGAPGSARDLREAPKFGVGGSVGVSTGVGPTLRVRVSYADYLSATIFPMYSRDDGYSSDMGSFFALGARWQRFLGEPERIGVYAAAGTALYVLQRDELRFAPGVGLGIETGDRFEKGVVWWVDVTYTAWLDERGLAWVYPLPQTGLMVRF